VVLHQIMKKIKRLQLKICILSIPDPAPSFQKILVFRKNKPMREDVTELLAFSKP
jgi:hypothetical protein